PAVPAHQSDTHAGLHSSLNEPVLQQFGFAEQFRKGHCAKFIVNGRFFGPFFGCIAYDLIYVHRFNSSSARICSITSALFLAATAPAASMPAAYPVCRQIPITRALASARGSAEIFRPA